MTVRWRPYGDHALLAEVADAGQRAALVAALQSATIPGVLDVVPGARTVLVDAEPGTDLGAVRRFADGPLPPAPTSAAGDVVLDVVYDGDDLAEVGELTGVGADGVVAAHTGGVWTVAFCGFAPGFGYLVADDARLAVPRREQARTRVPAGAVGLAGEYSGVYPRASPGGWQLIGRTDAVLWDVDGDPPALLRPGTRVRFRAC